jgi:DNA-binding CsgD family transcriptional regulator
MPENGEYDPDRHIIDEEYTMTETCPHCGAPLEERLPLSPTQLRVAKLSDRTAVDIADALGMNVRTVRAHLAEVRRRLGVEHKREILRALQ